MRYRLDPGDEVPRIFAGANGLPTAIDVNRAGLRKTNPENPKGPHNAVAERAAVSGYLQPDPTMDREWLGLRDLTCYANISERTLRSWIYSPVDSLPATKVCGKVFVRKSDFDAYLERHRITPLEQLDLDAIVEEVIKGESHGS